MKERKKKLLEKPAKPKKLSENRDNLAQFLAKSPLAGSKIDLSRRPDYGRKIQIE